MIRVKTILNTIPNRKNVYLMALGVFVKAILNFLGLAALLAIFISMLSSEEYEDSIWLIATVGVVFLMVKNLIVLAIDRLINKYLLSLYAHYSELMLQSYYDSGLLEVKKAGVTTITRDVNTICFGFVNSFLNPFMRMVGEGVLLLLMLVALIIYSVKITLLLLLLFIPLFLLYHFVINKNIGKYGKSCNEAKHKQWLTVEDIFKGYTEVNINGAYNFFVRRFGGNIVDVNTNQLKMENYKRIPPSLIEVGMAILLLVVVLFFSSSTDLKMFLGIFAVTAFKLLPSVTSLISSWMQVKSNGFTAEAMAKLKDAKKCKVEDKRIDFKDSIELKNVSFTYPDGSDKTVDNLSIEIKHRDIVGIKGTSGRGKTTLLNILQGFLPASEGEVLVDGVVLGREHITSWHKIIAYVPQEVFIMNGTVAENIALNDKNIDYERLHNIIGQLGLNEWFNSLPNGLNNIISSASISGGERQRLGIARALYRDAELLFLDEITSSLDSETEKDILKLIEELYSSVPSLTIVMVSHRESTMSICNKIIKL